MLSEKKYAPRLSCVFAETVIGELREYAGDGDITCGTIIGYISRQDAVLNILGGSAVVNKYANTAKTERRERHGCELQI
jgi:hypothetical protein